MGDFRGEEVIFTKGKTKRIISSSLKQQPLATVVDNKNDVLRLEGSCWANVPVEVLCI